MRELDLMHLIQIAATKLGARLMRNNVGGLWSRDGRFIRFGLGIGTSDLIGFDRNGRFIAIETKTPGGKRTAEQENFIRLVREHGGLAGFAESVEEAQEIIYGSHDHA
jgi:hypothetical protein